MNDPKIANPRGKVLLLIFLEEVILEGKVYGILNILSVPRLGVQALTSNKSACPLTQMVMQENTGVYTGSGQRCPTSSEESEPVLPCTRKCL